MWVMPPHDSLHRASQETPLGTSGEMLQVVKENEVALMHVVSHRTQPEQTQARQRSSPASPLQQHFTALRDVGVANPQAFRRGSVEQNLAEGLGRRTDVNGSLGVSVPCSEGFAADRDDLWVFKKRKMRSVVCVVGLGASVWLQDGQPGAQRCLRENDMRCKICQGRSTGSVPTGGRASPAW